MEYLKLIIQLTILGLSIYFSAVIIRSPKVDSYLTKKGWYN
jgi:hypothetical protein